VSSGCLFKHALCADAQAIAPSVDETSVVAVDSGSNELVLVHSVDSQLALSKKKIQPLIPGDMLDHKTGNGYNHGMIYVGGKTQAVKFAKEFHPDAVQDMTADCHYVIDFGPKAEGAGGDDVQSGWWPRGVKVSCADIVNDGTWRWKDYRPYWIKTGALSGRETIRRAFSALHQLAGPGYGGYTEYDFLRNNCHHFAAWCRYGQAEIADTVAAELSVALELRDIQFPLSDDVLVQEGSLDSDYGRVSSATYKVVGPGEYQIRILRTSTGEDHTEGRVTMKTKDGKDQQSWTFRSDKGGFLQRFSVSRADTVEITVTGSSHCWDSLFAGCHHTTASVQILAGAHNSVVFV